MASMAKASPLHSEWTGKFDGKDYPVTGRYESDTRALKQIDDRNFDLAVKKRRQSYDDRQRP